MKKLFSIPSMMMLMAFGSMTFLSSCDKEDDVMPEPPIVKPNLVVYGLTSANQVVTFNANASQTILSTLPVTGLQAAETLLGIDFRPATGQLYAVSSSSRLYAINTNTGVATALGAAAFTPAITGTAVGFDFNPTVDRIRLVTNTGQNLRLNPETGGVVAVDGSLNPGSPNISGAAYTNSVSGASSTILFDIDLATQRLVKQDPPNNGGLVDVGSLGVTATGNTGFDISPDNSVALAVLTVAGNNGLYQIDITTGKATNLGNVPVNIIGLAIPTNPVAYATDANNNLLVFNPNTPGTPVSKPITGLVAGESILGIDMRPATGQLFALGSTSILYSINMSNGAAAAVGTTFTTALSGTTFGFDFNPTVDRIRVVSNTGQNLRLNPIVGGIAAVDGNINPGTPMVSGSAYTNNFAGATTTTLFNIDVASDKLFTQVPPNDGTLAEVGALGINVEANNGFDIGGTSGRAYALLTVGSTTSIYTINLTTGAATALANFPTAARTFAVGLGF